MPNSKPAKSTAVRRATEAALKASKELERVLALHTRFPEEPEIGVVIRFEKTWPPTSRQVAFARSTGDPVEVNTYSYIAIHGTNGVWYTTLNNQRMLPWERLVDFIGDSPAWILALDEEV